MTALRSALTGLLLWGLTFPLTEACGWTTTALNGTVQSPDFPGNYPNNQSCVYIITAPEGYQVTLNFTDLDIDPSTNCTDGFVEIRDGDSETSPLIGRYCNQTLPGRRRTFGNQMWIKFVSDGNATGQGFRATFVSANLQAPYFLISGNDGYRRNAFYRMDVETTTYYALPLNISESYVEDLDFDPVEQTIYWSQGSYDGHIYASFINGSGKRTIPIPGSYVYWMTVDPLSRLIFYCHNGGNTISMVTMRTMATKTVINSSQDSVYGINLNTAEGVMFWSQYSSHNTIERANYDGSDRRTVVNESSSIRNFALDVSENRLYWMTGYTYRLKMSDLEGKGQSTVFTFYGSLFHYFERDLLFNTTFYFSHNSGYRTARLISWDIGSANYTVVAELPFYVNSLCIVQPGLSSDIELNGCGTNNGGCDTICIPLPNNGSKCLCPDGQTLTRNLTSCACPENYWGTNCSQTCNCSERATCDVLEGCVCNRGWSGVTCSTDVNECETMTNACGENQICQNNPGSFVCLCPPGFLKVGDKCVGCKEINGTQVDRSLGRPVTMGYLSTNMDMASPDTDTGNTDINECLTNPCDQICRNIVGGYLCECQTGYILNLTTRKTCIDLNKETDSAAVGSTVIAAAIAVSILVIVIIIVVVVIIVLRRRKKGPSERTQLQKDPMSSDLGSSRSQPSEVPTSL